VSIERKASIKLTPGCGPGTEVVVGGFDLTNVCFGLRVTADVNEIPRLELDLRVLEFELVGEARIRIPPATSDALIALGWTPPPDDQP
jgi:hypothetical protein